MINKLVDKIVKTNAPVVVGLDPMMKYIPEHVQKEAFEQYGETLEGAAEAIWQYNKAIIDNIYGTQKIIIRLIIYMILYQQLSHRLLCMSSSVLKDLRCLRRLLIIVTRRIWL